VNVFLIHEFCAVLITSRLTINNNTHTSVKGYIYFNAITGRLSQVFGENQEGGGVMSRTAETLCYDPKPDIQEIVFTVLINFKTLPQLTN
jgi:hypothetical protein